MVYPAPLQMFVQLSTVKLFVRVTDEPRSMRLLASTKQPAEDHAVAIGGVTGDLVYTFSVHEPPHFWFESPEQVHWQLLLSMTRPDAPLLTIEFPQKPTSRVTISKISCWGQWTARRTFVAG